MIRSKSPKPGSRRSPMMSNALCQVAHLAARTSSLTSCGTNSASGTYLGVERTLFYFVCVGAVGAFNLFNSILAGIAVFIGGFSFGHWVTNSDPAFLRILAKSERYKLRYDAAKQQVPRVEVV